MKPLSEIQAPTFSSTATGAAGTALRVFGYFVVVVFWMVVGLMYAVWIGMKLLVLATAWILQLFLIPFRW
jgi:hypothetical protein